MIAIERSRIEMKALPNPEIENDLTRRGFLAGTGSLLLLGIAGCGSGESASSSGETRRVERPMGLVELPVDPKRLVAIYATDIDGIPGPEPVGEESRA
jgi:hypothetical protein